MSFRNFVVAGGTKEVSFLPKNPQETSYGVGSPSVSINKDEVEAQPVEPVSSAPPSKEPIDVEDQLVENVADSDEPVSEGPLAIVGPYGIGERVRSRKGASVKAVKSDSKRKLILPTPPSRTTRQKSAQGKAVVFPAIEGPSGDDIHGLPDTKELPSPLACHQLVSHVILSKWKGVMDNMSIERLCDLHDKSYVRQCMLDNQLNARTRELLRAVTKAREEMDVMLRREKARDQKYADLEKMCEEALEDFDKNPLVQDLRAENEKLKGQLATSEAECSRLTVEGSMVVGYKEQISVLSSKCGGLEQERAKLLDQEIKLREKVDGLNLRLKMLKKDIVDLITKVIPYIAMELYHSDDVGIAIGNVLNSAIFHGKCTTLEEVAKTGEPVVLEKIPYYRETHEKEYDDAGNQLTALEFPFLADVTKDPAALIEDLLAKKPRTVQPLSSSKRTPSPQVPSPGSADPTHSKV